MSWPVSLAEDKCDWETYIWIISNQTFPKAYKWLQTRGYEIPGFKYYYGNRWPDDLLIWKWRDK